MKNIRLFAQPKHLFLLTCQGQKPFLFQKPLKAFHRAPACCCLCVVTRYSNFHEFIWHSFAVNHHDSLFLSQHHLMDLFRPRDCQEIHLTPRNGISLNSNNVITIVIPQNQIVALGRAPFKVLEFQVSKSPS